MSIATSEPVANGQQTNDNPPENKGELQPQAQVPVAVFHDESEFASLLDTNKFWQLQRVAKLFAASSIVPEQFQGNMPNCFIGMQMALRLNVDPFMFLQSCYIVHGRPGIEAKLAIALANSSGKFEGSIRYKIERDPKTQRAIACTASATIKGTGEEISFRIDQAMVEAEGWNKDKTSKSGYVQRSKWNTMPDLMYPYRSAMFLLRTHCPEVIMGMQSKEELDDEFSRDDPGPKTLEIRPTNLDDLARRLEESNGKNHEQAEAVDKTSSDPEAKPAESAESTSQAASSTPETEWPLLPDLIGKLADRQSEKSIIALQEAWVSNHPQHAEAIRHECGNRIGALKEAQKQQELIK